VLDDEAGVAGFITIGGMKPGTASAKDGIRRQVHDVYTRPVSSSTSTGSPSVGALVLRSGCLANLPRHGFLLFRVQLLLHPMNVHFFHKGPRFLSQDTCDN
jgi:hypothetical protein